MLESMFNVGSNSFTVCNAYKFNMVFPAFNFTKMPCGMNQFIYR